MNIDWKEELRKFVTREHNIEHVPDQEEKVIITENTSADDIDTSSIITTDELSDFLDEMKSICEQSTIKES